MSLIPAATVLLLRQNNNDMEVLLVERSSNTAFGDLYVFPGGKVDSEDNFSDKLSSHSDLDDVDCSKLLDMGRVMATGKWLELQVTRGIP